MRICFFLCFLFTLTWAQETHQEKSTILSGNLDADLIAKIRRDLGQRNLLDLTKSPIKANRPKKLNSRNWQCPISHEILLQSQFSDVLPNNTEVTVFYSIGLNIYWTLTKTSDGKEIWAGKFQFGLEEDKTEVSADERPTLREVEQFIQNVMVDDEEGGTGFFENQFLGIKDLGPKTLIHLDTLIKDHLQDADFQALCCRSMGELGDKAAIPLLNGYLNDLFVAASVKQEAIYTLAELGDRAIIDRLIGNYLEVTQSPQLTPFQKITIYTQLATMYYRLKEFDKSIECYQRCIQISPSQITYYNLACMYAKLGQVDKAIENLRLSIDKGYDEVGWMKKDGDLDSLREDPRFVEMIQKLEEKKKAQEESGN